MTIGERIKTLREQLGLTQDELAARVGFKHKSSVNKIEAGERKLMQDKIMAFAKALETTPEIIMGWDDVKNTEDNNFILTDYEINYIEKYRALDDHGKKIVDYILNEEYERSTKIEEPVSYDDADVIQYVGRIAAAGKGVYIDGIPGEIIKVKNKPLDASFAIGVTGDSMEPDYYDGDIVYVHKQSEIEFGEIGLWQIGSEFFIKEYHPEGLKSSNPNYPIIPASPEIRLIGKVIGTVRQ